MALRSLSLRFSLCGSMSYSRYIWPCALSLCDSLCVALCDMHMQRSRYRLKRTYGEAQMLSNGREAKRRASETAAHAAELDALVRSIAARVCSSAAPAAKGHGQLQPVPLIQRLAAASVPAQRSACSEGTGAADSTECGSRTTTPLLSLDEVVSNVHSFLLAGFETTAVLVLFCLLHLAHDQVAQADCATEAAAAAQALREAADESDCLPVGGDSDSSSERQRDRPCGLIDAALKETLRLYPPVISLPRLVAADQIVLSPIATDAQATPVQLQPGQRITVCTCSSAQPSVFLEFSLLDLVQNREWCPTSTVSRGWGN